MARASNGKCDIFPIQAFTDLYKFVTVYIRKKHTGNTRHMYVCMRMHVQTYTTRPTPVLQQQQPQIECRFSFLFCCCSVSLLLTFCVCTSSCYRFVLLFASAAAAAAADNRIDEYENFYCTYFTRYVVAHTERLKYFSVLYIYVWRIK